jgi:prepilin-type N-terminal cleavage/methylation domain-containing protein/prepilin-type processing-associated H-X9-DG protein
MRSQPKRAFTLIELLVVIAIIAILAAILFPVFAQARGKARSASCLSNCKQIGLSMMMYGQDFDEGLPAWNEYYGQASYGAETTTGGYRGADCVGTLNVNTNSGTMEGCWHAKLSPYVKDGVVDKAKDVNNNSGVWHCPDAGSQGEFRYFKNPDNTDSTRFTFSYGMSGIVNYTRYVNTANQGYYRYPRLTEMYAPANTIYVGDGGGYNARLGPPRNFDCYRKRVTTTTAYPSGTYREVCWEVPDRHMSDGANYVFCDGHAKWLKAQIAYPLPVNPLSPTTAERTAAYWSELNYWAYDEGDVGAIKALLGIP